MLSTESRQFLHLLPTFLCVFSTLFSLSDEASSFYHEPTKHFSGTRMDGGDCGVVSYEIRRSVLEGVDVKAAANSTLVLAAKRTHRKDPVDNFNYYNGGWNISEKHYFSSVGFTAAPLFLLDAFWFLGFGICLLVISLRHCCCQRQNHGCYYSRTIYQLSLIFLTLFTIAAIIGCIFLYVGQGKFHSSTTDALEYVVERSDVTVEKLRNVSGYLEAAKQISLNQITLPPNIQADIERVDRKINDSAKTLERETEGNSDKIRHVLDSVRIALIIIAAVMILLAFLGFAFSVFGVRFYLCIMVILGWILVAAIFILCGIFVIVHNVMADSCVAMDQWVQHPTAHTALDNVVPCVDRTTAQEALDESKDVTTHLVGIVNAFINNVANLNVPPSDSPVYYNQSGPPVPALCSPYNSDKSDRKCDAGEVNFGNAAQEWRKYLCLVSATGNCTTEGRLTPSFFNQMTAAVNVSSALHYYAPFLVDIGDCTFVREILSTITRVHCPRLSRSSEMISIGLVIVSTAVMLSVTLWLFYGRKKRQPLEYTEYHFAASVQDHSEQ